MSFLGIIQIISASGVFACLIGSCLRLFRFQSMWVHDASLKNLVPSIFNVPAAGNPLAFVVSELKVG